MSWQWMNGKTAVASSQKGNDRVYLHLRPPGPANLGLRLLRDFTRDNLKTAGAAPRSPPDFLFDPVQKKVGKEKGGPCRGGISAAEDFDFCAGPKS